MKKKLISLFAAASMTLMMFSGIPVSAENEPGQSSADSSVSAVQTDSAASAVQTDSSASAVQTDSTPSGTESSETVTSGNSSDASAEESSEDVRLNSALHSDADLATGYYSIISAVGSSKVMDIEGGSVASGANVQLYHSNDTEAQIFYVTNLGSGLYTIASKKSGMVLDVAGGSTVKGANLQQYTPNGTEAQKFYIGTSAKSGYLTIQSSKSLLCVDIAGGLSDDRTNIQMYTSNDTAAQQWKFEPVRTDAGLSDGYYRIASGISSSKVLDVDGASTSDFGNVQLYDSNGSAAQVFYVNSLGNGLYELMACCSGRLMDLNGGLTTDGRNIDQYWRNGSGAQKWYIRQSAVSGFCTISSSLDSSKVLDAAGGSSANGTNIQLYSSNDTAAQQWSFTSVSQPQVAFAEGLYTIGLFGTAGQVLDIQDESLYNGGNLQLFQSNGTNTQKFYITSSGSGTYMITNANSQLVLDVAGGLSADRTNVQQYESNGTSAQRWKITGCPGRYTIQSVLGKNLDAAGGSSADHTNMQIYTPNGTDAQYFWLQSTKINSTAATTTPVDGGIYMISSALDSSEVISVPGGDYAEGLQMEIFTDKNADYKKFQMQRTSDGYYIIMNVQTGLVLTAKGYGTSTWSAASGTSVIQYNEIESNTYKNYQKWKLIARGDGTFNLVNYTGYYLDVTGGKSDDHTKLDVYTGNGTNAQVFRFSPSSTATSLRSHGYATAPNGETYWLEGTYWTDPTVSDTDFLAAAIYCEGGDQGLAGEMMIGYSMLNRTDLSMIRYTIYQYGQYEICRDRVLTAILTAIHSGDTSDYSKLDECREAAAKCVNGDAIVLTESGLIYGTDGSCKEMTAGTSIARSDFTIYDGFMTTAAFERHNFTPFGHHVIHYKGHYYYVESEIWG
ncbi:MAG: RICIN domain-containing protein [Lachnospiraceae bacterium]|jgi:hypothetical protein|nr:RICIN domain-containing protein [Lachnospiraceae bacterium]